MAGNDGRSIINRLTDFRNWNWIKVINPYNWPSGVFNIKNWIYPKVQVTKDNVQDNNWKNGLFNAIKENNAELVEHLLLSGADCNIRFNKGHTALHVAVIMKATELELLFDKKCPKPKHCIEECTAFSQSIDACYITELVEILLRNGTDANIQDDEGVTSLHIAASNNIIELVDVLLRNGADANIQDKYGQTAFHKACSSGNVNIIRSFINNGCSVNNKGNVTPLHMAVQSDSNLEVFELLLKLGATFDRHEASISVLQMACCKNSVAIARRLIELGCDLSGDEIHECLRLILANTYQPFIHWDRIVSMVELLLNSCPKITESSLFEFLRKGVQGEFHREICSNYSSFLEFLLESDLFPIFNQHTIKMSAIHNLNVSSVDEFSVCCRDEISQMKLFSIKNTTISLYDILKADVNDKIVSYMGNEEIVQLSETDYRDKFPIYSEMIVLKCRRGYQRRLLFDKGMKHFGVIFKDCPVLPYHCKYLIFTFLADKDLRVLDIAITGIV